MASVILPASASSRARKLRETNSFASDSAAPRHSTNAAQATTQSLSQYPEGNTFRISRPRTESPPAFPATKASLQVFVSAATPRDERDAEFELSTCLRRSLQSEHTLTAGASCGSIELRWSASRGQRHSQVATSVKTCLPQGYSATPSSAKTSCATFSTRPTTTRFAIPMSSPTRRSSSLRSKHGTRGTVSKLVEQPYRSGKNSGWIKVKSKAWRAANRDRWELFESAK
jgi:hypothetical protein